MSLINEALKRAKEAQTRQPAAGRGPSLEPVTGKKSAPRQIWRLAVIMVLPVMFVAFRVGESLVGSRFKERPSCPSASRAPATAFKAARAEPKRLTPQPVVERNRAIRSESFASGSECDPGRQ